jgi:hypothetical protein
MRPRHKTVPVQSIIAEALRKIACQLAIAQAAAVQRDTPLAERIADEITAIEDLKAFVSERLQTPGQMRRPKALT